jgi:hypothetical protein
MSGEISLRSCDRLYLCEQCEFDQTIQDEIDRRQAIKTSGLKKVQAKKYSKVTMVKDTGRSDN